MSRITTISIISVVPREPRSTRGEQNDTNYNHFSPFGMWRQAGSLKYDTNYNHFSDFTGAAGTTEHRRRAKMQRITIISQHSTRGVKQDRWEMTRITIISVFGGLLWWHHCKNDANYNHFYVNQYQSHIVIELLAILLAICWQLLAIDNSQLLAILLAIC